MSTHLHIANAAMMNGLTSYVYIYIHISVYSVRDTHEDVIAVSSKTNTFFHILQHKHIRISSCFKNYETVKKRLFKTSTDAHRLEHSYV